MSDRDIYNVYEAALYDAAEADVDKAYEIYKADRANAAVKTCRESYEIYKAAKANADKAFEIYKAAVKVKAYAAKIKSVTDQSSEHRRGAPKYSCTFDPDTGFTTVTINGVSVEFDEPAVMGLCKALEQVRDQLKRDCDSKFEQYKRLNKYLLK